jgi:hypothetical protein
VNYGWFYMDRWCGERRCRTTPAKIAYVQSYKAGILFLFFLIHHYFAYDSIFELEIVILVIDERRDNVKAVRLQLRLYIFDRLIIVKDPLADLDLDSL